MADPKVLTVDDVVADRSGEARWAVRATFASSQGSELRCVDYRVRVLPEFSPDGNPHVQLAFFFQDLDRLGDEQVRAMGELPREGIPRYVFEQASQARLLEKAREQARALPDDVGGSGAFRMLKQQVTRRAGRPPSRTLEERLRILQDVEETWLGGGTLKDVAQRHHMSRSAVRDLLEWARSGDSGAPLFEGTTPGRRGGGLTPAGRALIEHLTREVVD